MLAQPPFWSKANAKDEREQPWNARKSNTSISASLPLDFHVSIEVKLWIIDQKCEPWITAHS